LQINPTEVFASDNFVSAVIVFKTLMHPWIQAKQKIESESLAFDAIACPNAMSSS
jgi:hypothetical protein